MSVARRLRTSRSADRLAIWRMTNPGLQPGWSVVGVVLGTALVLVAWVVQRRTGISSLPVIALVASAAVAVVGAALVGSVHRALVPLAIAIAISYLAYDWRGELLGGPLSGPFGYRNAFGALLLQGAIAWLVAGFAFSHPVIRVLSLAPAALLGTLAVRSSSGAAAGVALVLVAGFALLGTRGARIAVAICGVAVAAALVGTIWLGVGYEPGAPLSGVAGRVADTGITERRLALWHDALTITGDEPWGVGHGRFGFTSPTALADRDAIYAHNEFLEQGAELGWAGIAAMVLLVAWGFVRLAVNPRPDAVTALAAVALAGTAIHACIDFVWHFPAVPLVAATLVGTGLVPGRARSDR